MNIAPIKRHFDVCLIVWKIDVCVSIVFDKCKEILFRWIFYRFLIFVENHVFVSKWISQKTLERMQRKSSTFNIQYAHRLSNELKFFACRTEPYFWQTEYFLAKRTFLANRYSMVRYGTLKVLFVKKSMRVLHPCLFFCMIYTFDHILHQFAPKLTSNYTF